MARNPKRNRGEFRAFTASRSSTDYAGEPSVHVRIATVAAGSRRGGVVRPAAFGLSLPESLARQLRDSLTRALKDDEKGGHSVPTLGGDQDLAIISEPGEDDVS